MKTFRKDLQKFEQKLILKENFSFARYGDGEMAIIENKAIDILHKENGEFNFYPDKEKDKKYQKMLIDAFTNRSKNYFVGIACPCCVGSDKFIHMKKVSNQEEENLTWANLFVNSNYSYFISNIVPLFLNYDVYVVCNEKAVLEKLPFAKNIKKNWRVGSNAWKNDHRIEKEIKTLNVSNSLFLFAAGPYSKILCHRLWEFNKKNTYLDIGSTLDPLLFGAKGFTRGYLRGASTLKKTCLWEEK